MSKPQLPADALRLIFEHLPASYRLPCLLVCRTWMDAAIPIIYRRLLLSSANTLERLAQTFATSESLSSYVSKHTKAIIILDFKLTIVKSHLVANVGHLGLSRQVGCSTPAVTNDLLMVLMELVDLHEAELDGLLAPSAMAVFSRITPLTLTHLTLNISDKIAIRGMSYVANFLRLQELKITLTIREDDRINSILSIKPWVLQDLHTFVVSAPSPWTTLLAQLLCRCHYPNLRKLDYGVPVTNNRACELIAQLFKPLCNLEEASLKLEAQFYSTILPRLRVSSLEITPINALALDYISLRTKTLRIPISDIRTRSADIWDVFDALLTQMSGINSVALTGDDFCWKIQTDDDSGDICCGLSALPLLLNYVIRLSQRGIAVRDTYGKTLQDYLNH